MISEILTWVGVAIAALATYGLYRSAERSDFATESEDSHDDQA